MTPEIMNTKELAAFLRVHPNTVTRLVGTYRLPCVRLTGKSVRFMRADIERWLSSRKVDSQKSHLKVIRGEK